MKNKKGFTLVELLAVIVILALIMGIAIVSIGNVVQDSRKDVMYENAQSVIDAVKKTFAINFVNPEGSYGFDSTILSGRGVSSPMGGNFKFGSATGNTLVTTGLWKLADEPASCTNTSDAYVTVSNSGVYTLCLAAGTGNYYVSGSESDINAKVASVIKK